MSTDRHQGPGPGGRAFRALRRNPTAVTGAFVLAVLAMLALFAPFLAPYAESSIDRQRFYHPPQAIRFRDASGRFTVWPEVRDTRLVDPARSRYEEIEASRPLRWFVHGDRYPLFGMMTCDLHLFGLDPPARINLLGTDPSGRDVLSRLLYGARVSLTVGLIGIAISFSLGMLLGGLAGYLGGRVDDLLMRLTELLLSIPVLYLLLGLRAVFPADLPSGQVYLAIVAILALLGWAGLARVIRGMVLSLRRAEFVAAAEALGMNRLRVLVRHILPNTMSFVIVAATIAVPGYILGEVVLSFLGLGVQEPSASWGNMLAQARSEQYLRSFPWMLLAPGAAILVTVMAFNLFGDGLRDALDPRAAQGRSAPR